MKSNFEELSLEVWEGILKAQKILNSMITEDAAIQRDVYINVSGERSLRKVRYKLVDSEDSGRSYEFECLP